MADISDYKLVHVTTDGEYKAPLVASQLFDQAEFQAVVTEGVRPLKVEAWIIGSMREYIDKASQEKLSFLRNRCPHINVRMINGVSRLNKFPILPMLLFYRRKLNKNIPVIYHCRGEFAVEWALKLKEAFPGDKVVFDVRGYWPAEMLYQRGIEDPADATGKDREDFEAAFNHMKKMISLSDAVTTVSDALKDLLIREMNAPQNTNVVPCCVSEITADAYRDDVRKSWGLSETEIALVYSGTTAAYQHLDDLTIPFLKQLTILNRNIRLVFLSPEIDKIKIMVNNAGISADGVIFKSLSQNEVAGALNACDVGILIRKPTLVNRVANPVKIGEYLAAGLPIIIAKNVGGVSGELFERSLLEGVEITSPESRDKAAIQVNNWLQEDIKSKRPLVKEYATKHYLWRSAVHLSRKMYKNTLEN